MPRFSDWRSAAATLVLLGLSWIVWRAGGILVTHLGVSEAPLLQQAGLLVLFLTVLDWVIHRIGASQPGDTHG